MPSVCGRASQGWTVNGGSLIAYLHFNVTIPRKRHLFFRLLVCTDCRLEKELLFRLLSVMLGLFPRFVRLSLKWPILYRGFFSPLSCDFFLFLHQNVGEQT